jgi:hypothetical protein
MVVDHLVDVLAHNHIAHTTGMGSGINGFRCWTWPKGKVPRGFKHCNCGWSGLPHVATPGQRCITVAKLLRNLGLEGRELEMLRGMIRGPAIPEDAEILRDLDLEDCASSLGISRR